VLVEARSVDSFELLESRDGGLTFAHLASVRRPASDARVEGLTVRGDSIELAISSSGAEDLDEAYWLPWDHALAAVRTPVLRDRAVLRSADGARHFTLE